MYNNKSVLLTIPLLGIYYKTLYSINRIVKLKVPCFFCLFQYVKLN